MLVMLLEDHKPIRDMLKMALVKEQYEVLEAENVGEAKRLALKEEPEVYVVDWMLPDISGIKFIRWLRRQSRLKASAVIMLTAKNQDKDTIMGLDAGADDYMSKPVSIAEFLARVRALERRPKTYVEDAYLIRRGSIELDTAQHVVTIKGKPVKIKKTEFRLLKFFLEYPKRVWSRAQIIDRVWGMGIFVDERTVDVHILRLRKVLKRHNLAHLIETVRGTGYRFAVDEENVS